MKNRYDRFLYIKTLQENTGRIIMDKLFDKFCSYINYRKLYATLQKCSKTIIINDPINAFFDTLCRTVIEKYICDGNCTIYLIMSPYHKKEVIYSLLVVNNKSLALKVSNLPLCKVFQPYTIDFSADDIKYLNHSYKIFRNSNKIQQE
ncbi:MAG: hypothetical protein IKA10_02095 [Oscillospiraceae bacterium]|nr:hypothetical protein [Oscillospiraceae bacterium]